VLARKTRLTVVWKQCASYEDAEEFDHVVYLFEIKGRPFYWGKAEESFFGGPKRERRSDRTEHCGRYGPGYDHLVKAFLLQKGHRLFIGKLGKSGRERVKSVELYLIRTYGSRMQPFCGREPPCLDVKHTGVRPRCIQDADVTRK
jgi:hypothetical protein